MRRAGQTSFNAADRTQPRLGAARPAIQIQHQDQIVRIGSKAINPEWWAPGFKSRRRYPERSERFWRTSSRLPRTAHNFRSSTSLHTVNDRAPARRRSHAQGQSPRKLLCSRRRLLRANRLSPASHDGIGGAERDRTDDLMLAKHALSQLSYSPSL